MILLAFLATIGCKSGDDRCPDGAAIVCDGTVALTCDDRDVIDESSCGGEEICVDDVGCASCDLTLPVNISVAVDPTVRPPEPWHTLEWTAVSLEGSGSATLDLTGNFTVHGIDGAEIEGPVSLPTFVWLRAMGGGTGTLTMGVEGCDAVAATTLTAKRLPGLSSVLVPTDPSVHYVDAFPVGSTLRVAIDPARYARLHNVAVAIFVVEDRDRQAWLDDPSLSDVAGGPSLVTVNPNGIQGNFEPVWADLPGVSSLPARYDIVVDADGDGTLSPGDLLDGADGPGFVVFPDLTEDGSHAVASTDVSSSFWRTQRIWWPADLAEFEAPAPVVVISHGNGHEHTWYDYLGEHLASWGYVVMSHRNDTAPGVEAAATTTLDNTDFFLQNATAASDELQNIDTHNISLIGHSRGAEGVAIAYERLRNGSAGTTMLEAEDIQFISSIAPTVFTGPGVAQAGEVPFHMLVASADGDVTGGVTDPTFPFVGCSVCQSWRLLQGSRGPQVTTYIHGAIHNDFNCCGPDDGQLAFGPKIGRQPTQRYTKGIYLALLGHFVQHEPAWGEYLTRMPDDLTPFDTGAVATQYRIALEGKGRFLDDFQSESSPTTSSSGTEVRFTVDDYSEAALDDSNIDFTDDPGDPMNGMTQAHDDGPMAAKGAVFSWSDDASWEIDLPEEARDLTKPRFLSMRVAQSTRHPLTVSLDDSMGFGVALIDADGVEQVIETTAQGRITAVYPRSGGGDGTGWANEFNTVRIRLTDFEGGGLDLSDIRTVRLRFGIGYGAREGRLGLDDLVLED